MRPMSALISLAAGAALVVAPLVPASGEGVGFRPGDDSAGDPYVGKLGNGGYDVSHYDLDVRYDPASDMLWGTATIEAVATQNLSRFNLDLRGLTVRSVTVDGAQAKWQHLKGELRTTPGAGVPQGTGFTTVVTYDGVPATLPDGSGFVHTNDGAMVIGQPEVAATWFPVNDHPSDKASYHFDVTVPDGITAVANGALVGTETAAGWTTFTWDAPEPMASYLATATTGRFDLRSYEHAGIKLLGCRRPLALRAGRPPRTGAGWPSRSGRVGVQAPDAHDHRPGRGSGPVVLGDPGHRAVLGPLLRRGPPRRGDDWTTLPDANGHSAADTGASCPYWLSIHPFLRTTRPTTVTTRAAPPARPGSWTSASGASDGYEQWSIDLSAYAGAQVEVSLTYASDDLFQYPGVFIDDVVVSTGGGTRRSRRTATPWTAGPRRDRPREPGQREHWVVGEAADVPPPVGDRRGRVARAPGRDPRLPRGDVRAVPVRDLRRHRRRRPGPRFRAREPDPPDLLDGLLTTPARTSGSSSTS